MFLPLYACHLYREQDCSSCNLLKNSTSVVSLKMPFFFALFQDKHHDAAHEIIETIR